MKLNYSDDFNQLALEIKQFGKELGFNQVGITDTKLSQETEHLRDWLLSGYHGNMSFFEKHLKLYEQPQKLLTQAIRAICCRIDYPPPLTTHHPLASFALIQDYSCYIKTLLKKYVDQITRLSKTSIKIRAFAGSAPILEKALAIKAGLGWYGKNSLVINQNNGSYSFLGEILIDLPLPIDQPQINSCGSCFKCGASCPTKAIVAPYEIDARRCIAYLTIENKADIPLELRPLLGNKIFGCDICQQICPWNNKQQAHTSALSPFTISSHFTSINLLAWFLWDEKEFQEKTKNSPINRISHECWLRNIAVALGNSEANSEIISALKLRLNHPSPLVREHVEWALKRQNK